VGLKLLISRERIAGRVAELGREIGRDLGDRPVVVIGVLTGAFLFAADLVRALEGRDVRVDFLAVSSYGSGTAPDGPVRLRTDVATDLAGRDVLVVEDVVDTGGTVCALREHLAARGARSVRVCALLDKAKARGAADYVGFAVADRFVVGYGLDLDGRYRHLPDVYTVEDGA
jgi:hypoxanthine phosphoribosyltransferase